MLRCFSRCNHSSKGLLTIPWSSRMLRTCPVLPMRKCRCSDCLVSLAVSCASCIVAISLQLRVVLLPCKLRQPS